MVGEPVRLTHTDESKSGSTSAGRRCRPLVVVHSRLRRHTPPTIFSVLPPLAVGFNWLVFCPPLPMKQSSLKGLSPGAFQILRHTFYSSPLLLFRPSACCLASSARHIRTFSVRNLSLVIPPKHFSLSPGAFSIRHTFCSSNLLLVAPSST